MARRPVGAAVLLVPDPTELPERYREEHCHRAVPHHAHGNCGECRQPGTVKEVLPVRTICSRGGASGKCCYRRRAEDDPRGGGGGLRAATSLFVNTQRPSLFILLNRHREIHMLDRSDSDARKSSRSTPIGPSRAMSTVWCPLHTLDSVSSSPSDEYNLEREVSVPAAFLLVTDEVL